LVGALPLIATGAPLVTALALAGLFLLAALLATLCGAALAPLLLLRLLAVLLLLILLLLFRLRLLLLALLFCPSFAFRLSLSLPVALAGISWIDSAITRSLPLVTG